MRIIVLVGRVLDPSGIVVNRRRGRIFINREEYLVNPADRCALEAALRIKDATGAEVVALPRGPLPDDDVLRQALAAGADRAVYLTGDGFKGADDAVMARVLAAAVERLGGADLVLAGATTLDTRQGQLGPRLAEALGWPQIVGAWQVEATDGKVQAVLQAPTPRVGGDRVLAPGRRWGKTPPPRVGGDRHQPWSPLPPPPPPRVGGDRGGGYATVETDLPAVVTVLPGALKPRYPDGARLINIYRAEDAVERWDVADLVEADALKPLLERRGQDFPPERERGVRVSGTPEEMAQAVADALRQQVRG